MSCSYTFPVSAVSRGRFHAVGNTFSSLLFPCLEAMTEIHIILHAPFIRSKTRTSFKLLGSRVTTMQRATLAEGVTTNGQHLKANKYSRHRTLWSHALSMYLRFQKCIPHVKHHCGIKIVSNLRRSVHEYEINDKQDTYSSSHGSCRTL